MMSSLVSSFFCGGFALGSLAVQASASADQDDAVQLKPAQVIGTAYRLNDFGPLYREFYHPLVSQPNSLRVLYRETSAEPVTQAAARTTTAEPFFAVKDVDYGPSRIAPAYNFVDLRLQQLQLAKPLASGAYRLASLSLAADVEAKSAIEPTLPLNALLANAEPAKQGEVGSMGLVTDAGFDQYVVTRWSELVDRGSALSFDFAVPSRAQTVAMSIRAIDTGRCNRTVLADLPTTIREPLDKQLSQAPICLKLEAKNWLIGQVLKPIYLVYDSQQQLRVFRGLSNIRGPANERLRVFIHYEHINDDESSAALAALGSGFDGTSIDAIGQ